MPKFNPILVNPSATMPSFRLWPTTIFTCTSPDSVSLLGQSLNAVIRSVRARSLRGPGSVLEIVYQLPADDTLRVMRRFVDSMNLWHSHPPAVLVNQGLVRSLCSAAGHQIALPLNPDATPFQFLVGRRFKIRVQSVEHGLYFVDSWVAI